MEQVHADFMLWMGDNVYFLNSEWESYEGMFLKYVDMRLRPELNEFLKSKPQYAVWDDHDYGPNDSDGTFHKKDSALFCQYKITFLDSTATLIFGEGGGAGRM